MRGWINHFDNDHDMNSLQFQFPVLTLFEGLLSFRGWENSMTQSADETLGNNEWRNKCIDSQYEEWRSEVFT